MEKKKLLIVDPDPHVAEYIHDVAETIGYDVKVTTNAKLFMEVYESFQPDVVTIETVLHNKDGIELIKWLATRRDKPYVLIVTSQNPTYAQAAKTLAIRKGKMSSEIVELSAGTAELADALVLAAS